MELKRIRARNFLALRDADVQLAGARINVICGNNEAGKSSLVEALRFAVSGEVLRVTKKGEYPLMITDGAKTGDVLVEADDWHVKRDVKSADTETSATFTTLDVPLLPYVLDAHKIAQLQPAARRGMFLSITKANTGPAEIRKKLAARDTPAELIEEIMPVLRGGFDPARDHAASKATQARGAWKALTGETYGTKKAPEWKADAPEVDREQLPVLREKLDGLIGDMEAQQATIRRLKGAMQAMSCPHCHRGVLLNERGTSLIKHTSEERITEKDVNQAERVLDGINLRRAGVADEYQALKRQIELADTAEERTQQALEHHREVLRWSALAEALGPEGIPAEILATVLKPVNDRLRATASATGWKQVMVQPDMSIQVEGKPYGLQSESARWRADAAVADVIAHLSGMRLLVLDRIDVLDVPSRSQLIKWVAGLANDYDTIVLLGTLKRRTYEQMASSLPATFRGHWLERGELEQRNEEAAA